MAETYEITAQTPTTIIGGDGLVAPAIEVSFTTIPSGVPGKVRIPTAIFTTDEVRKAVEKQAAIHEAVARL